MFGLHYLTQSWAQSFQIPSPSFTETHLSDQTDRVHLVTGGYCGVGAHLTAHLYARHATVYIAGRSPEKAAAAIAHIRAAHPNSRGHLEFLALDLADLASVRSAADAFRARQSRLHVLVNNAGVANPPHPLSPHGHEIHLATNCLGLFLLTQLLLPVLRATAAEEQAKLTSSRTNTNTNTDTDDDKSHLQQCRQPQYPVRVLWAASLSINLFAPRSGVAMEKTTTKPELHPKNLGNYFSNYGQSKAGNYFYATEFHRRYGHDDGILSFAYNPGNLDTNFLHNLPAILSRGMNLIDHPARLGAYPLLFGGWSPDLDIHHGGSYIIPWGRLGNDCLRPDVLSVAHDSKTNPDSPARQFWEWSERETARYI